MLKFAGRVCVAKKMLRHWSMQKKKKITEKVSLLKVILARKIW